MRIQGGLGARREVSAAAPPSTRSFDDRFSTTRADDMGPGSSMHGWRRECVQEVYPDGAGAGNKMARIVTVSASQVRRAEPKGENVVIDSMSFDF
jgi:hypothetical protein